VKRNELVPGYCVACVAIVRANLLTAALGTFNFKVEPGQDDGALKRS
jgi:hypothetical protein